MEGQGDLLEVAEVGPEADPIEWRLPCVREAVLNLFEWNREVTGADLPHEEAEGPDVRLLGPLRGGLQRLGRRHAPRPALRKHRKQRLHLTSSPD